MQARDQSAETHDDKFLKVAQRTTNFLGYQDPEPRIRTAPLTRPDVAADIAGGSRMKDILGTDGEDTDRHQTLTVPRGNQPKRKRREPQGSLNGGLASIVAAEVEKFVSSHNTGSDEDAGGVQQRRRGMLCYFPTSQPPNPVNTGLPLGKAKASGAPHPPSHSVRRPQLHPRPPRPRRHPHQIRQNNPSRLGRLPPPLLSNGLRRRWTNPKLSEH